MILALAVVFVIENGFDVRTVLTVPAVGVILGVLYEFAWRRQTYVTFQDAHVLISRFSWGRSPLGQAWHPRPNVTLPYSNIVGAMVTSDGDVELAVNSVDPPYVLEQPTASVTFRPARPQDVIEELKRRIPGLAVTVI